MSKYIIIVLLSIISVTTSAQKYEKFRWEGQTFYKILYKNGAVGLSIDKKKNVICGEERGYTDIERTHTGVNAFIVKKGDFSGVIDKNGNEIIKPNKYQYIDDEAKYALGYKFAFRYYKVGNGGSQYNPEKQGACSLTGEEIIPCLYKSITLDYIKYEYNNKDYVGFYFKANTPQNHIVLSDTLDETLFYSDKYNDAYIRMKDKVSSSNFKDNIIGYEVRKDGKFGFCDKKGNEIIAPIYEGVNCDETLGYRIYIIKLNGKYGVITENRSLLIEPKYDFIYPKNENLRFFNVEIGKKRGVLSEDGSVLIEPIYDGVCYHYDQYEFNHHFSIELNNKNGWCDCNGNIIFEPIFNEIIIYSSGKYQTKINGKFVELNPADYTHYASNMHNANQNTADNFETKRANIAERIDELANKIQALQAKMDSNKQSIQNTASTSSSSYSTPSSSNNSFAPPSSSSYSSNTNSKYKALNDPNLVDNSEEISRCEKVIAELENQKLHCSYCNGTHKIPTICTMCRGTGTIKMGYYTPQFFKCNYCGGTGRTSKPCIECQQTDVSISISRSMLKTYKETHGMTKETAAFYHEHNSKMAQMDRDHQNAINAIAEPYLNSTRKSNSSHSSASSSSKCSLCNGTGIDPHVYHSGDPKPAVGGYTHSSGGKCVYCGKYEWHQHVYCPKCNANKYP